MAKKATAKKKIRPVTSAEEQRERAELQRYNASVRRLIAIDRLRGKLFRLITLRADLEVGLATMIAEKHGYRVVPNTPAPEV